MFGGLVPIIGLSMISLTGNNFAGLFYPLIVAAICFVVGFMYIKETKDVDISEDSTSTAVMCEAAGRAA